MKSVPTYAATIYCGLKPGYEDASFFTVRKEVAFEVCQEYCDEIGLGLTFTETTFIYTKGNEQGVIIGLINYPRFPSTKEEIKEKALTLASRLKEALEQIRMSIVFSDETIMIGEE